MESRAAESHIFTPSGRQLTEDYACAGSAPFPPVWNPADRLVEFYRRRIKV